MLLQVYTQRDTFNPKYHTLVIDQQQHRPVVFPNFAEPVCFSSSGRYCVLAKKKEFEIKRDPFLAPKPNKEKGQEEEGEGKGEEKKNEKEETG